MCGWGRKEEKEALNVWRDSSFIPNRRCAETGVQGERDWTKDRSRVEGRPLMGYWQGYDRGVCVCVGVGGVHRSGWVEPGLFHLPTQVRFWIEQKEGIHFQRLCLSFLTISLSWKYCPRGGLTISVSPPLTWVFENGRERKNHGLVCGSLWVQWGKRSRRHARRLWSSKSRMGRDTAFPNHYSYYRERDIGCDSKGNKDGEMKTRIEGGIHHVYYYSTMLLHSARCFANTYKTCLQLSFQGLSTHLRHGRILRHYKTGGHRTSKVQFVSVNNLMVLSYWYRSIGT